MRTITLFSTPARPKRRWSNLRNQLPILATLCMLFFAFGASSQVFISQYAEANSGSVPKAIEIYNASGADIDLSVSNIQVYQGTNGAAPAVLAGATTSSGILEDGKVWVIGTVETTNYATTNGTDLSGVTTFTFSFNGDDALQLYVGGVLVDVFGTPGVDPGTSWTGGSVNTANQNIQTVSGICSGSLSGWSDPSTRFEVVIQHHQRFLRTG
ncbi:MAG: lamin tail domain-containing protein [Bacteroidia bacterium]